MSTPTREAEQTEPAPDAGSAPDEAADVELTVVSRASRHAAEAFYLAVRRLAREHGLEVSQHEVHNPIPGVRDDGPA